MSGFFTVSPKFFFWALSLSRFSCDSVFSGGPPPPIGSFTVRNRPGSGRLPPIIIITETLIVKMLLYGHSIAGEKVGCKGQELWSGESTTSLNHVRHLQRNRSCSNPPK
jgi:hypothetical protein